MNAMKTFIPLYNMKSSRFCRFDDESLPTADQVQESKDYFKLPPFQAKDLEHAYYLLNMDHPKPVVDKVRAMAESDPAHTKYPSLHTSMSVGDVLIEVLESGCVYHFCDSFGWKNLDNGEES